MLQLISPLAIIDLETTGINLGSDRIVEIAIVKVLPDGKKQVKRKLINPEMPIPAASSDIHGITNEMVKDAPTFRQVANELKQFLDHCDLAGYNSNRFDIPMLAEEYKASHPGVSFEIAAEGSTTGIAAITDGTAAIGMSSRRAKATEVSAASAKGVNMKPTLVCYDGIALVVNAANPVANLTKRQVEQIFTGDVTDWSAVGGKHGAFSVYTRNTSSGTYSDFKELAMKKRDYASSSQKLAGNDYEQDGRETADDQSDEMSRPERLLLRRARHVNQGGES